MRGVRSRIATFSSCGVVRETCTCSFVDSDNYFVSQIPPSKDADDPSRCPSTLMNVRLEPCLFVREKSWTWSCTTASTPRRREGSHCSTYSGGSHRSSPLFHPFPRIGSCVLSDTSSQGDTRRGERKENQHASTGMRKIDKWREIIA